MSRITVARQQKTEQPIGAGGLDELRSKEAALKAKLDMLQDEITGLAQRLESPAAGDTAETLTKTDERLRQARVLLAIARRDHESAAAARQAAETEIEHAAFREQRRALQARVDELAHSMPPAYRRLATELLALVAAVHTVDEEIAEYNKARPPGFDRIETFEQRVRWTLPAAGQSANYPARLSSQFEIPALQRGDVDFRVPGTRAPAGVWFDVNGRPHL